MAGLLTRLLAKLNGCQAGGWKAPARFSAGEGDTSFEIDGVSIFSSTWARRPEPPVLFREPLYGQWHKFDVYEVEGRPDVLFAATEVSNCMWVFLVPIGGDQTFDKSGSNE